MKSKVARSAAARKSHLSEVGLESVVYCVSALLPSFML